MPVAKLTPLEKVIARDYAEVQDFSNTMFEVFMKDLGEIIDIANKDCIESIASFLSIQPDLSYKTLNAKKSFTRLQGVLNSRYENLSNDLEIMWEEKIKYFDLLARVSVGFIARKASPPWIETKLDLKSEVSMEGRFSPRKGYFRFTFEKMAAHMVKELERGALAEENLNKMLNRVRRLFNKKEAKNVREENYLDDQVYDASDDELQFTTRGPVNIDEGFYTLEDVDRLLQQQKRVNQWDSRSQKSWMTDAQSRNNQWLRSLEQLLMSDALDQLHEGVMQIGPKNMGINDMVWVTSRPSPVCEYCSDRDGMTMKEIKKTIDDDFGDQVPPLHPNCRCQLVPEISQDWAKSKLSQEDYEWNPDTGIVYNADTNEKNQGYRDMTLDEYLQSVRG